MGGKITYYQCPVCWGTQEVDDHTLEHAPGCDGTCYEEGCPIAVPCRRLCVCIGGKVSVEDLLTTFQYTNFEIFRMIKDKTLIVDES